MSTTTTETATILQHLGGNQFLAMTGCRVPMTDSGLLSGVPSVTCRIGRNPEGVSVLRVALDRASDTYTVSTFRMRAGDVVAMGEEVGVVAGQLRETVEFLIGLRLSL